MNLDTIVVLSGGMDSTTLLYHTLAQALSVKDGPPPEVRALTVNYGQRHAKEIAFAKQTCEVLGVEHRVLDLSQVLRPVLLGSALTDDIDVPEGHYADESMRITVVPNRNMMLLSLATCWAVSTGSGCVAYAAHAGDHAIYPDCRTDFADAMAQAMLLADYNPVSLERPFIEMTKDEVAALGDRLGVDWSLTWSCYQGGDVHCGKCGTCVERREAFELAGVEDPTDYE